jgi:hypothetical protein
MKAAEILESYYFGERCRHCGESPPTPGWKCCASCWNQIFRGGAPVAQPPPAGSPTQLTFDLSPAPLTGEEAGR